MHGGLIFNLGDDARLAFQFGQEFPQFFEVGFFTDEAERDQVHSDLGAKGDVGYILGRHRRQIHPHARQIDMAPRAERARR